MRFFACLLMLAVLSPLGTVKAEPVKARIGAYVSGLRDLDMRSKTFDADIWWWAVTPETANNPLKTMEFTKDKKIQRAYDAVQAADGKKWFQTKVSGTFHKDWDLRKYPFDRQVLSIPVEEGITDVKGLVYEADGENSSINPSIRIAGWKVVGFSLRATPVEHKSTFGDPSLQNGSSSTYAGAVAEVTVQRSEVMSFVQLTTPVYLAFLVSLVTFFMKPDNSSMNGPRYSMLVGSLFLMVINLRAVNEQVGTIDGIGLVQAIHLWAMSMVLVVTVTFVYEQRRLEAGTPALAVYRLNTHIAKAILFAFAAINFYLLYATSL